MSDLEHRECEVLKSVIRGHIASGAPMGSRTVSRRLGLDLSPATIRNIMADLEERKLLSQPYPSAGRVPTDMAYRLYVDRFMSRPKMSRVQAQAIDEALQRSRGEIPELLEEASRQLSHFSKHVGVVLAPEFGRIVVEQVEFVRLSVRRIVAIVVGRSGVVLNRILEMDEDLRQEELNQIGRHLSECYGGRTLPEMRNEMLKRMSEDQVAYEELRAKSLELGSRTLDFDGSGAEVFVEGTSNLFDSPEFSNIERMQTLLRALEEKNRLVVLLGQVLESDGVQVVIGNENPDPDLSGCSLVASKYCSGGRVMGTVGIVGPTRMEYARAVVLVDYLAGVLSRLLSSQDHS